MPTRATFRRRADALYALRNPDDLARLLGLSPHALTLLAHFPEYRHFTVPKRDGSRRAIEDPAPALKKAQQTLNRHLQASYYFHRSEAAYGFVSSPDREPQPRNILTNAQRHLGQPWMLNIDYEDFFHSIGTEAVRATWGQEPFNFGEDVTELLTGLVCHGGRLPMGAPTSPGLSNWVCRGLDRDLTEMARRWGCRYSRFADDLTFSAAEGFSTHQIQEIRARSQCCGYRFNDEKLRVYGPSADKIVTGLCIYEDHVGLTDDYFKELDAEIVKLRHAHELLHREGSIFRILFTPLWLRLILTRR